MNQKKSNFYAKQLADIIDKETNRRVKYIHKVPKGYSLGWYFYTGRQYDGYTVPDETEEISDFLEHVFDVCQNLNIPIIKSGTKQESPSYVIVYVIVPKAEDIQGPEDSENIPDIPITLSDSRKMWKCWRDTDTMEDFVQLCDEMGFSCEKIAMFYWKNRKKFDYLDYDKDETFEEVLKSFEKMII